MKRNLSFLFVVLILIGTLTGCRNVKEPSGSDPDTADSALDDSDTVSADVSENTDPADPDTTLLLRQKPYKIEETDFSTCGLQVDEKGVITLNGSPFYGMGLNFHQAYTLCLDKMFYFDNRTNVEAHFRKFSEYNVPFIRLKLCVFYGDDVKLWADERYHDKYIAAMDYLFALAEKYNVGIIASLFWEINAFNDYAGDTMEQIANPKSNSTKLRLAYIKEIVGRYKYSPALWAWEIGNELNLAVDIPNTKFVDAQGKERLFTSDLLTAYYTIIGNAIREEDPYRMITGGDSAPRTSSMALYRSEGTSWRPANSYEDDKTAISWYTPKPLNVISLHYPELDRMKNYAKIAKELNIGLFIGEFHGTLFQDNPGDTLSPEESDEEALEQSSFRDMLDTYLDCDVQLITYWCYGSYTQKAFKDPASLELGVIDQYINNYYVAEAMCETNNTFIQEGKTDAAAYWNRISRTFLNAYVA